MEQYVLAEPMRSGESKVNFCNNNNNKNSCSVGAKVSFPGTGFGEGCGRAFLEALKELFHMLQLKSLHCSLFLVSIPLS